MRSGITSTTTIVTRLGTNKERTWIIEVGIGPSKKGNGKLWLMLALFGDGIKDWVKTIGIKLPSLKRQELSNE